LTVFNRLAMMMAAAIGLPFMLRIARRFGPSTEALGHHHANHLGQWDQYLLGDHRKHWGAGRSCAWLVG
jgi:hypothetical protein